jgi:hypothetical protein
MQIVALSSKSGVGMGTWLEVLAAGRRDMMAAHAHT